MSEVLSPALVFHRLNNSTPKVQFILNTQKITSQKVNSNRKILVDNFGNRYELPKDDVPSTLIKADITSDSRVLMLNISLFSCSIICYFRIFVKSNPTLGV